MGGGPTGSSSLISPFIATPNIYRILWPSFDAMDTFTQPLIVAHIDQSSNYTVIIEVAGVFMYDACLTITR